MQSFRERQHTEAFAPILRNIQRQCRLHSLVVKHQATRQMQARSMHILDLDQNLIIKVCSLLSVRDKLQLRLVNKLFLELLDEPAPGCRVWGVVDLHDLDVHHELDPVYRHAFSIFAEHSLKSQQCVSWNASKIHTVHVRCRWLLNCAPGVTCLRHMPRNLESPSIRLTATEIDETNVDKRELILRVLPRLSGFLSEDASIRLDLRWGEASSRQIYWLAPSHFAGLEVNKLPTA